MDNFVSVVLMDNENFTIHASGRLDSDKIVDTTLLKRNKRLYYFRELKNGVAFYTELVMKPYEITEF